MAEKTVSLRTKEGPLWTGSLWGKGPNPDGRCRAIVVVGPYPTKSFFEQMADKFRPREVTVVVDEGWRDKEVEAVRQSLADRKVKTTIRYARAARGIVHAKLYYIKWEVRAGGNVRRSLLWGSANASQGGFAHNAEALSGFVIPSGSVAAGRVEAYFKRLGSAAAGSRIPEELVHLSAGLELFLPGFEIREDMRDISFDSWLQKGVLCHPFQPDPQFGTFSIRLRKPLPNSALVKYVADRGLASGARHDLLRMPFIEFSRTEKSGRPRWKTQFFTESWLGYWTSGECAAAEEAGKLTDARDRPVRFEAPGAAKRTTALEQIGKLSMKDKTQWLKTFEKKLQKTYDGLVKKGAQPGRYFKKKDGLLDVKHYMATAEKQLRSQSRRATTPVFRERFLKGYEFGPVPPLRGIGSSDSESFNDPFEEFADSIAETITMKAARKRRESRLLLAIEDVRASTELAVPQNHETLLRWLRRSWPSSRETIRNFYLVGAARP